MLQRLRTNYQLALITLFSTCSAIGILPFAIYRFASGATVAGIVDTLLVIAISIIVAYALKTGNTRGPGLLLVLINSTGAVVSATLLGEAGLFWMYAVQMTNYFLVSHRVAAATSIVSLGALAFHGAAFESNAEMVSFLVTSSLVGLLAYILSSRTEGQRRQLERLATLDPLTGAHNRRAMESELAIAVDARRRGCSPTSLLIFDIDRFKRVNDERGHDAGDQVLRAVADQARAVVRSVDRIFRYGGEEFVVLLPNTDAVALAVVAEHVREGIEKHIACDVGSITISAGGAELLADEGWPAWLARADAALYRAKHEGRNRVSISQAAEVSQPPADGCTPRIA